jgi:type IV fimbrial biogenesis protein FimT
VLAMSKSGPQERGFTLIELLVVMTVMATMLTLAIPSFRNFIASQRVKSVGYDLTTAFLLARSEAVKRNADVTVAAASASDWTQGWSVKVGTTTLQQQQAVTGVTITKAGSAAALPANFVYGASGRMTSGAGAQYLQVNGASFSKCVKIDITGIPSTQPVACP